MALLVAENLVKHFSQGRVTALRQVNAQVQEGEFVAIMGASGSGKSTLLHLMAGLDSPDGGRILFDGQEMGRWSDQQLTLYRRHQIGLVFQAFNLIPTLTAAENIALPLLLDGGASAALQQRIDQWLAALGLTHRKSHRPDALSGGEQQRVAIGRALIADARVLLADEPTGNLDSDNSRQVCQLLQRLNQEHGKTVVLVTHEPDVAAYAQRVLVLRDGQTLGEFASAGPQHAAKLAEQYRRMIGERDAIAGG